MLIKGITVTADPALGESEITALVDEELQLWHSADKNLGFIDFAVSGDEIVVNAKEKSPIRRVRRITGYLSDLENFNEAKRDECVSRVVHPA
jgi:hypothetical protein